MSMKSYLLERKTTTTFYFRRILPKPLQLALKQKEWQISLRTSDKKIANARAQKLAGASTEMFAELVSLAHQQDRLQAKAEYFKQQLVALLVSADATRKYEVVSGKPKADESAHSNSYSEYQAALSTVSKLPNIRANLKSTLESLSGSSPEIPEQTLNNSTFHHIFNSLMKAVLDTLRSDAKSEVTRKSLEHSVDMDSAWNLYEEELRKEAKSFSRALASSDSDYLGDDEFEDWLTSQNLQLDEKDQAIREKSKLGYLKAHKEAIELFLRELDGEEIGVKDGAVATVVGRDGLWDEAFAHWKSFQNNSKTIKEFESALLEFRSFVKEKPLELVTQEDLERYQDWLIESQNNDGAAGMAKMHRRMAKIRPIIVRFATLRTNYRPVAQVFEQFKTVKPEPEHPKMALKAVHLNAFFSCPIYANLAWDKKGGLEALYWLPVLALHTGARAEELGQLGLDDITLTNHGYFLKIEHSPAKGKRVKNGMSRSVPLHTRLGEFGFFSYVERLKKAASKQDNPLFPNLLAPSAQADGKEQNFKRTKMFSTRFNELLDTHAIDAQGYDFHSFRNNFADELDRKLQSNDVRNALMGHTSDESSASYGYKKGSRKSFRDETLREVIEKIEYEEIDFKQLKSNKELWQSRLLVNRKGLVFDAENCPVITDPS